MDEKMTGKLRTYMVPDPGPIRSVAFEVTT